MFPLFILLLLLYAVFTGGVAGPIRGILQDPTSSVAWVQFIGFVVAVGLGITFHEFMHAWTAHRNGDDTGRSLGRMSLDPRAHLDVFGSLLIVLIGFGYGKPVPINEARLRNGRFGVTLVSLAGPLTNLALAAVAAIPLRAGVGEALTGNVGTTYETVLVSIVVFNCLLGVFNLLPVPPLDGSKVVYGLLPARQAYSWRTYETYGPFILLAILFLLPYAHIDVLGPLVVTPARFLVTFFTGQRLF